MRDSLAMAPGAEALRPFADPVVRAGLAGCVRGAELPGRGAEGGARLGFGLARVDDWLGGGLRRDGLHEFHAGDAVEADRAAATALALLLAMRALPAGAPLLWLMGAGGAALPYGPGLVELGVDADALLIARLPDPVAVLKAAADAVRHGGAGAVLIGLDGRAPAFDLTASRRLTLAAERTGTLVLMVRGGATEAPTAAHSRWRVAGAPSPPLMAGAPGRPAFDLRLLRQRGGPPGLAVQLVWDRDDAAFREYEAAAAGEAAPPAPAAVPLSGGVAALPARRAADRRRAA